MTTKKTNKRRPAYRTGAQTIPVPGKKMVRGNGVGFGFQVDDRKRFERFVILGTEGSTYYAREDDLATQNATCVERIMKTDGPWAVQTLIEISAAKRALKNDPAIFALAGAIAFGNDTTRRAAYAGFNRVVRTGTHLFHFMQFVKDMNKSGRGLRNALSRWFLRDLDKIAYQVVKYQARDGWSTRDVLRLAHVGAHNVRGGQGVENRKRKGMPEGWTQAHSNLFAWVVDGPELTTEAKQGLNLPGVVQGFERAKDLGLQVEKAGAITKIETRKMVDLIAQYKLTREMIPTQFLTEASVWEALLVDMPMTAMIRNLGNMSKCGLLVADSAAAKKVCDTLANQEILHKAGVHPLQVLDALRTYGSGHSVKGSGSWTAVQAVVGALDDAFYLAFANCPVTNKAYKLGLDVSGSMSSGKCVGVNLTPQEGVAVMAMAIGAKEDNCNMRGFSHRLVDVPIRRNMRLDAVIKAMAEIPMGMTDCALPIVEATKNQEKVEVFITLTDNETNHGSIHPYQALVNYREKTGNPAKSIVIGVNATHISIADPDDAGTLDMVGFDKSGPLLIADFATDGQVAAQAEEALEAEA